MDEMFSFIFRVFWRLLILAIGIGVIGLTIFEIYPYADSRLPAYIVILLIYCGFAYVVIPFLMRLLRLFIKPAHIPLYVTSGDGWPSDPVNLAVIARNKKHLCRAMKTAGWHEADKLTFRNGLKEVVSIVFNKSYPAAPLSNLYLFNRPQDIGFEIPTNDVGSARTRHHVRFWKLTEPVVGKNDRGHYRFWKKRLNTMLGMNRELWIGAATEETHPIDIQWRTGQITHGGSHDSNRERDFIIDSLRRSHGVRSVRSSTPGKELRFRGQQFRTIYTADGGLKVARLK